MVDPLTDYVLSFYSLTTTNKGYEECSASLMVLLTKESGVFNADMC